MSQQSHDSVAAVKEFIASYIAEQCRKALAIDPRYGDLWQSIQRLLSVGGKYIRPSIVCMTAAAYRDDIDSRDIVPIAASTELLHAAMLVHDDIIDRDDVRYGVKNVSGQYVDTYTSLSDDRTHARHLASSAAIMAGDALLSAAYQVIHYSSIDPATRAEAARLMADTVFHVVGGELLDTETSLRGRDSASPLLIAEHKTSRYSFCLPLLLGAAIGGAPAADRRLLEEIGIEMGVMFQLRDDELGVFGDTIQTGKPNDSDLREGKWTYMVEQFYELATPELVAQFEQAFSNRKASARAVAKSRRALEQSGAREAVRNEIDRRMTLATRRIAELSWNDASRKELQDLLLRCTTRHS